MLKRFARDKDILCEKTKRENSARWVAYGPGVNSMEAEDGAANYRDMRLQGLHGLPGVHAIEYDDYQKEKQREKDGAKRERKNSSKWA